VIPVKPPLAWFQPPAFVTPTPMRITSTGRVTGHAAAWGQCHTGFPGECRTPPRSVADYAYFLTGEIETAEGELVPVGQITFDTDHPGLTLDYHATKRHLEITGLAAADVNVGEDNYGVWMAGALRPTISAAQLRELRASPVSGHWCRIGGNLELVGLLAVNCQGFPQLRIRTGASDDRVLAASALGIVTRDARRIAGDGLLRGLSAKTRLLEA
jgi:hypothetical protein